MGFAMIGELIGVAVEELGDLTRAGIAASLREVADKVERGELVSDERIDALKETTQRVRELLANAE